MLVRRSIVPIAFWMLLGIAAATPALIFFSGNIPVGILLAYLAVATGALAISIRSGESDHLVKVLRPVAWTAGCILLWMIIQITPMPLSTFGHPIWSNAQAALGEWVFSSITVDVGATLVAILRFCAVAAVLFIATATCIDRNRAETLLVVLTCLAGLFSLALIATELLALVSPFALRADAKGALKAITNLGVVISSANIVRTIERYETRKGSRDFSLTFFAARIGFAGGVFLECCVAAVLFSSPAALFSTAAGFLLFLMILLIRRLDFRIWEAAGLLAVAALALGLVASLNPATGELTIRFAHLAAPVKAIVSTMIANSPRAGNGAGTIASILPIYQNAAGDLTPSAATTAAISVIELGRIATWLLVVAGFATAGVLFKAALSRGRDSFYSTAGASCLVILLLESFCDSSLLTTPALDVSALILGLAIAQRLSRTDGSRLNMT